jgi:hypothetical protein
VDSARGALTDVETLPSSHHFHLLNDPRIHTHLLRWLAPDDEAPDDEAPDDEAPDDEAPDDEAPDDDAPDDEGGPAAPAE